MTIAHRAALALALALCRPGFAQEPSFPPAEAHALLLKQQGRHREAGRAFLDLLGAARGDAQQAALAEYYAVLAFQMARQSGDWRELIAALDASRVAPLARAHPALADALGLLALQAAFAQGDYDAVRTRSEALGFIDTWQIVGPFDNERGGGFARAYGPEQQLDLTANYEGKKRRVQWRPLPVESAPAGRVDLDAMTRPNDQVLCYAAACLEADRDRQVVLRIGSDEAVKVFVNGVEVLARDVRRRFAHDQDEIALQLRAGPNLLLVKVCEQEGAFAFAARLTEPSGAPVEGVVHSAGADALRAAAATRPAPAPATPSAGARAFFAGSVDATGDPRDAFRLAYLLASAQPDDPTDRRDHRLALRAAEAMPSEPAALYLLALSRMQPDTEAQEREENARRHDFERILERHPDHAQALLELAELELASAGAATRAEALLRRALAANPDFYAARVALARALDALHLDELAMREIETAARPADGSAPFPAPLREYGRVCAARGDLRGAVRAHTAALALDFGPQAAVQLAELALRAGLRAEATQVLLRAARLLPFERRPRLQLAELLEAEGALDEARAEVAAWLKISPEDDDAMVLMARLCGLAGEREAQREWLRTALELNPNRKVERRYLEFLEADEKPFYAGFELDGDLVIAADPGPPADAAAQNDPYYWLLEQRVVRAYRNGTTSEYRHAIVKILNDEGARRLRNHYVDHFPGEQRARLLDARIIKPDGQVLRPRLRGYYVELPALATSDVVELRSRVDDVAPSYFGDYFGLQHTLVPEDGAPCQRSILVAILEPGREYKIQLVNGAPEGERTDAADGCAVHRFEMRGLQRVRLEERRPARTETEALVRITTYRDWDDLAGWWWNLIRKQIEVSPAMRAKVDELTSGLASELDKIAAIYDFVTTDIRYTAWEFGVHGYKPYRTPVIFERRHGDCKDKALLLGAMLSVIGVEAHPVLIHAAEPRSADDLSLAMVQHFNHCISYLPAGAGRPAMFLDGTATYHPLDTVPTMDQGATVLVVEEGAGRLQNVPWSSAADNRDETDFAIELRENGNARVVMLQQPVHNAAVPLREMLGNEPAKRQEKLERRLARAFGKVDVQQIDCSDLLDTSAPVELRVEFETPEFAVRQDDGLVLKSTLEARDLMPLVRPEQRALPLLLGTPQSEVTVVRYALPAGYAPLQVPTETRLEGPFGSYSQSWSFANGELRVERRSALAVHRVEPADYAAFRSFVITIDQADRKVALVRKEGR